MNRQRTDPLVLFVEDDFVFKKYVIMSLEDAGFEVRTATGYDEALAMLDRLEPDLLLADLMIPPAPEGFWGRRLCQEAGSRSWPCHRAILTNREDEAALADVRRHADEVLLKSQFDDDTIARLRRRF